MARVQLPASKLKARKRKRRLWTALFFLIALCVLFAGAAALSHAPFLRIEKVEISGAASARPEAVEEEARKYLRGAYGSLFAKNNILLYPKERMREGLLKEFPVFASASVSARDLHALEITIVERAPQALWCEGSEALSSCLLLDEGGAAYALAADFTGSVYVRYFGPLQAGPLPRQFMEPEQFRALSALVDELGKKLPMLLVDKVALEDGGAARVFFADGFELIIALADNGADVLERFSLALEAEPFASHDVTEFEYLDLRFGDKLYYKLKEGEKEEEAQP